MWVKEPVQQLGTIAYDRPPVDAGPWWRHATLFLATPTHSPQLKIGTAAVHDRARKMTAGQWDRSAHLAAAVTITATTVLTCPRLRSPIWDPTILTHERGDERTCGGWRARAMIDNRWWGVRSPTVLRLSDLCASIYSLNDRRTFSRHTVYFMWY